MSSIATQFNMSLYIPRCDTRSLPRYSAYNSDLEYERACSAFIGKQFELQKIGKVDRVDLVRKTNPKGFEYFIAFVHFDHWYMGHESGAALQLLDSIRSDSKAKLQFHERWYWIVNENKNPRTVDQVQEERLNALRQQNEIQAQQLADCMAKLEELSCQVATSVLPEEDRQVRSSSPVKRRRLVRPSPVTLADHVEVAMATKHDKSAKTSYDPSFQPDVEAGIVQHPDDSTPVEEAIANGHVATRSLLKIDVSVTEDAEDDQSTGSLTPDAPRTCNGM
tara:strand:- start:609 stop:1442 length:834 start_codon:yes stop_codon:yes gene_type:complete